MEKHQAPLSWMRSGVYFYIALVFIGFSIVIPNRVYSIDWDSLLLMLPSLSNDPTASQGALEGYRLGLEMRRQREIEERQKGEQETNRQLFLVIAEIQKKESISELELMRENFLTLVKSGKYDKADPKIFFTIHSAIQNRLKELYEIKRKEQELISQEEYNKAFIKDMIEWKAAVKRMSLKEKESEYAKLLDLVQRTESGTFHPEWDPATRQNAVSIGKLQLKWLLQVITDEIELVKEFTNMNLIEKKAKYAGLNETVNLIKNGKIGTEWDPATKQEILEVAEIKIRWLLKEINSSEN